MTYEPPPYPESRFWRTAPPLAAAVLAAVGFVVMLAAPVGLARTVALVVVFVVEIVLMAGRGIVLRRAGRDPDDPVHVHQFFFAWSFFTTGIHLLGRDDTTIDAVFDLVSGLVFSALLTSAFLAMNRAPRSRPRRGPGS